jgi:hypothetical protein
MNSWLILITSLPTENTALRQRTWRALKTAGAAVLRDGVYLLPEHPACRTTLNGLAADVLDGGGSAHVLRVDAGEATDFKPLFDRTPDFAVLLGDIALARQALVTDSAQAVLRQARKLRKSMGGLVNIDFFPGEAQRQAERGLCELEAACTRAVSPGEPEPRTGAVVRRTLADHQGRTWATRQRPWVDRLASAWLIRRFIDPQARFLWLADPAGCPADALGFDFDGATFSHVGHRVTFEVLVESFGLDTPPLARLGLLVHHLDVGGVQPPEAAGIESVLAGMRENLPDDDRLLAAASSVFDGLLAAYTPPPRPTP